MITIIIGALIANILTILILLGVGNHFYKKNKPSIDSMIENIKKTLNDVDELKNKIQSILDKLHIG